ncbi:TetR/AcrR family transcriptional regulator [Clostridia bacterium OttesenSCG-928-O13]|nr:TetR/AcrR family transcriptional regulator [Clostridia bacterium OttesenSCG-928-O13]
MPADSCQTASAILESAKDEFLRCGFAGASLRRIAAGAKVTTGALYRHFKDKDALFEAVVAPVYTDFLERYNSLSKREFRQLEEDGMDSMWQESKNTMGLFVNYIYDAFDIFKLLLSGSEQTPYEHFTHTLIDLSVDTTMAYIKAARALGYPVRNVGRDELHILTNAQYSCLYEMVLHNMPREAALAMAKNLSGFFIAGWQAILLGPATGAE